MSRLILFCCLAATWLVLPASADPLELQRRYNEAATAYDQGNMPLAIENYEAVLASGNEAFELYYNLGNARFRSGLTGQAVASYRRAWMDRPRDIENNANLSFAMNSTGVEGPAYALPDRFLFKLSAREWAIASAAGFWIGMLLLTAGLMKPSLRGILNRMACLALVISLTGLSGIWRWEALKKSGEVIITSDNVPARFAPLEDAPVHFELKAGMVARTEQQADDWMEVEIEGKRGWIHAHQAASVYPCR